MFLQENFTRSEFKINFTFFVAVDISVEMPIYMYWWAWVRVS